MIKKRTCLALFIAVIFCLLISGLDSVYAAKKEQTITIEKTSVTAYKTTDIGAKSTAGQTGNKLTYKSITPEKMYVSATGKVFGKAGTYKIKITAPETAKYESASKTFSIKFTNSGKWNPDVTVTSEKCGQITAQFDAYHGADGYKILFKKDGDKNYSESRLFSTKEGRLEKKKDDSFSYAHAYKLSKSSLNVKQKYQVRVQALYNDKWVYAQKDGKTITKSITTKTHKYGDWKVTKEPTCEKKGKKQQKCEYCGDAKTASVNATGHKMSDWSVAKEPGCEEKGIEQRTCVNKDCDHMEVRAIAAIGHKMGSWHISKAPKCEEKGEEQRKCVNKGCTKTESRSVKATGHNMKEYAAKAPTCTETGWDKYQACTNKGCTKSTKVIKPALGHDMDRKSDKAPTCTTAGWKNYEVCRRCGKTNKTNLPALGHDYKTEFSVDKKATFTSEGRKSHHCTRCNSKVDSTYILSPSAKLKKDKFKYNGSQQIPSIAAGNLKFGTDYTFEVITDGVNVGKHKVRITLGGKMYDGSKTLSYDIVPTGTKITKYTKGKKSVKVYWRKNTSKQAREHVSGYIVQISRSRNFSKVRTIRVKGYNRDSLKIKKLKKKIKYFARIRTYMNTGDVTEYSAWSGKKAVKTK